MRASLSMWQLRQQVGGRLIKRERTDHSELTGSRRSSSLHFCIHSQKCRSSAEIAPFPRMLSFGGRFGCRIHSPSKVTFSVFVPAIPRLNVRDISLPSYLATASIFLAPSIVVMVLRMIHGILMLFRKASWLDLE